MLENIDNSLSLVSPNHRYLSNIQKLGLAIAYIGVLILLLSWGDIYIVSIGISRILDS